MGRTVHVPDVPQRIISLVPSQTELLYDLGLEDRVVGITKFCVHPEEWRKSKRIVGGTKQYRYDVIEALQPDLIIGNKEENEQSGIERLAASYPVWMSDINTLEDAIQMISSIGDLTQQKLASKAVCSNIRNAFQKLVSKQNVRALYLIWRTPYMAAGRQTFIDEMLALAGFNNCIQQTRYPELDSNEIEALNPDIVLLSSEPYPFAEKHREEIQNILPDAKIMLVDGEMFSWYGSRLIKTSEYFNTLK